MRRSALLLFVMMVAVQASGRESPDETAARIRAARPMARAHLEARGKSFGIFDIDQQLRETDAMTLPVSVIFRYQQHERGVEVYAAGITVQVSKNGVTDSNSLAFPLRVDTIPKIPQTKAIATAFRHLDLSEKTNQAEAVLVIVPHARFGPRTPVDDRLAWKVELWGTDERRGMIDWAVFVDAHEGTVILAQDLVMTVQYGVL